MGVRIVALLALATSIAIADPAADIKAHLAKAKAHFDLQEYADAERELKSAYRLDPKPDVLYGIAQAQRLGGACDRAIVTYKTYLRGNPAAAQHKLAEDNIATCEAAIKAGPLKPDKPNPPNKPNPDKPDKSNPDKPHPDQPDKPGPLKPAEITVTVGTPWYANMMGHGFLVGGLGAIAGGVRFAMRAENKIDTLNASQFYDDFVERSDKLGSAKTQRTIGVVTAGAGAVAVGVALVIYKVRSPRTERRPATARLLVDPRGVVSVAWER